MADVAFADRAKKCVRDRVADYVRVRMSVESAIMWDLDTTKN